MTESNAVEVVAFIRQLWPKWAPPEFSVAELEGWMMNRLTHTSKQSAMLAINAEAEEQHARQFSKSAPIVKEIKRRLLDVNRAESGENTHTAASLPAAEDTGPIWGRNAQGELTQDGRTAAEWADSHERMADELVSKGGMPKARKRNYHYACKLRARAASLRANGFTLHPPFHVWSDPDAESGGREAG